MSKQKPRHYGNRQNYGEVIYLFQYRTYDKFLKYLFKSKTDYFDFKKISDKFGNFFYGMNNFY